MSNLTARLNTVVSLLKEANREISGLDRGVSGPRSGGDRRQALELGGLRADVATIKNAVLGPAVTRNARL